MSNIFSKKNPFHGNEHMRNVCKSTAHLSSSFPRNESESTKRVQSEREMLLVDIKSF